MNICETLNKMQNLCATHDILFKIDTHTLTIRKYVFHRGEFYKFNRSIEFKVFTQPDFDLEDCVLTFEKKLDEKLAQLDTRESDNNDT